MATLYFAGVFVTNSRTQAANFLVSPSIQISSGRIISTYMHDFLAQFHGGVLAYDEGMCKDDPIMAAALWRNLFTSSGTPAQIAALVDYVRKELQILDNMTSDEFLESRKLFGTQAPALLGVPGK